jgi:hypothetical protein
MVPAIIVYALGYSFDFEEKTIVPTGAIYLKSYPSGAEIYLDDKPKGKTNRLMGRLIPKAYEVKVTKEDYHSWGKTLSVKEGLVTKFDTILLVPFNPKILLVATDSEEYTEFFEEPYSLTKITDLIKRKSKYTIFNIDNLNFNSGENRLYFLSNNNLYFLELDRNDIENSTLSEILVPNALNYIIYKNGIIYLDYFTEKIFELDLSSLKSAEFFNQVFPGFEQGEWILSNDEERLLSKKTNSVEILWLKDFSENPITHKKGDIEKISFRQKINNVIWHPETDEHLIISTNNSILVTELDSRPQRNTVNFITTEMPEIKYDVGDEILYFLSQDRLYQTNL